MSAGSSNWVPVYSGAPLGFDYYRIRTAVTRTLVGNSTMRIDAQAPVALYGKATRLLGVEVCSDAGAEVAITNVLVDVPRHQASGIGEENVQIADPTSRTDAACRVYSDPTPVVLTAGDSVGVQLAVYWSTANATLSLGRATFIFEPTSTAATAVQ